MLLLYRQILPFFEMEADRHMTGLTCRTPKEYVDSIDRLFSDPIFYQKLRKNIKHRKQFFLIGKIAKQHMKLYRNMLKGE